MNQPEPMTPDAFDLAFDAATNLDPQLEIQEEGVASVTPPLDDAGVTAPAPAPEPDPYLTQLESDQKVSAEEQAILDQIEVDFPEVQQAFAVRDRVLAARMEKAFAERMQQVIAQITQQVAPAVSEAHVSAKSRHEATILKEHADAFTIVPQVEEWVKKQPAILQPVYDQVLSGGSAAQVVELLTLFKKDTGAATPPPGPAGDDKEKRLAAQEGVRARHTSAKSAIDPNDFDGAFDAFAAKA